MRRTPFVLALGLVCVVAAACGRPESSRLATPAPLPNPPLGSGIQLTTLPDPPTPARVRLGRLLFHDPRLSVDGSVSCATCHRPENAFSTPTAVSEGVGGRTGTRKSPSFVNQAVTLYPHFFWDGRAASLEDQALGPVANPVEMGNTVPAMVATLSRIDGYAPYFAEAFGTPEITSDRVAKAIADYERTRMSGNSPWDRWRFAKDESAVPARVKDGHELFFGKAGCNQCHLGNNFTDSTFHNVGVGWDPGAQAFLDEGRAAVTKRPSDAGAFKTPGLREVTRRAPYMHDGSIATLREVVAFYNRGGLPNPNLDPKMKPLGLAREEIDALVAFMQALEGEGYQDTEPLELPR